MQHDQFAVSFVVVLLVSMTAAARQKPADDQKEKADLLKAVQNPVASLISVPLQNNSNFDIGIGPQLVNLALQFYGNPVYPAGGSPWSMRMQLAFLYPKKAKAKSP